MNAAKALIASLLALLLLMACQPEDPIPTPSRRTLEPTLEATPTDFGAGDPDDGTEGPATTRTPALARLNLLPPRSIDPAQVLPLDGTGQDIVANVFAGLARMNTETGAPEPYLADRWERLADGVTWHVFLKDDLYWTQISADTGEMAIQRPVTSFDVVYAVRRACQSATGSPVGASPLIFLIEGCEDIFQLAPEVVTEELVENRIGVRVLNENAIEFVLTRDSALFPTLLTMPMMAPQPSEQVEALGADWTKSENVWASGPYVIQSGIPAEEGYTLVENAFWPLPRQGNVTTVQITFGDPAEAYQAWAAGELDLVAIPESEVANPPFGETPAYRLMAQDAAIFWVVNYETPPMDNPLLRLALSYSLPRQNLIDQALEPTGQAAIPAFALIPPGAIAAPEYGSIGGYEPARAQTFLAAAGYPDCEGMPTITLLIDETFDAWRQIAEESVAGWQDQLGCKASQFDIQIAERIDLLRLLQTPNRSGEPRPALVLLAWQADYPDSYHWLADIMGCQAKFPSAYLDQTRACIDADTQLQGVAAAQEAAARSAAMMDISEAFFGAEGEMPLIPIAYYARPLAINNWVEAYPLHAGPLYFDAWIINAGS